MTRHTVRASHWELRYLLFFFTLLSAQAVEPRRSNVPVFFRQVNGAYRYTSGAYQLELGKSEATLRLRTGTQLSIAFPRSSSRTAEPLDPQPGRANYLIGSDPEKWQTNIPLYGRIRYRDLYPGIDLIYYGNQRQLEYDLIVSAGADVSQIQITFEGAARVRATSSGDLSIQVGSEEVRFLRPSVYQEIDGGRCYLTGRYVVHHARVGFQVDRYDRTRPLIIDPVLIYSTFLGGSGDDIAYAVATDSAGNNYIAGSTTSSAFPTSSGAVAPVQRGGQFDVFVTKLNPTGGVVYSTYLGGTGNEEAFGMAVDSAGNAYVTGYTNSTDFPVTAGALGIVYSGGQSDGFVAKLNPTGTALVYSSYLGGPGDDTAYAIAVDTAGNAYITGSTTGAGFPTTVGAYRTTFRGGTSDAFISKLSASGTSLIYSTYVGGTGDDVAYSIAVDFSGNALVAGETASPDFPNLPGSIQAAKGGTYDAFVTSLNPAGTALNYSTFLGGAADDYGYGIAIDASGAAYVTGYTASTDFPHTAGVRQTVKGAGYDAFVAKIPASGATLTYSTFLGGGGDDFGLAIAVDQAGNAYVTGDTTSLDFPLTPDAYQNVMRGTYNAFVATLNASATTLTYATYIGGKSFDTGYGIAAAGSGTFVVSGYSGSSDWPVSPGALQPVSGGASDAFFVRFGTPTPPTSDSVTGVVPGNSSQNVSFQYSSANGYGYLSNVYALFNSSLSAAAACAVFYDRPSNALYLYNDAGSALLGPLISGSNLHNGQCTVNAASMTGSGNTLTLTLNLTFSNSFGAAHSIYMYAADAAGLTSGWQNRGTTAAASPPTADSVTGIAPNSANQTLTLKYSSPNGFAYLTDVYALFNNTVSAANTCAIYYDRGMNAFYLLNDAGAASVGPLPVGSNLTLQNGQCTLNGTGSTVSGTANTLTLTLSLSFKNSFGTGHTIFMYASDASGLNSAWQNRGTTAAASPPTADSVTGIAPNSPNQVLTFKYSSVNGYAYLSNVYALVNNTISATNACAIYYDPPTNAFYLFNDTGSSLLGPLASGSSLTLQNGQCTLNGTGSTVSGSGNTLTMALSLTFSNTFSGIQNIYMYASDVVGLNSGWQNRGTTAAPTPPTADSVTGMGNSASQSLTFKYTSANGYADLSDVYALFNNTVSAANTCAVYYDKATNAFYLLNDSGTASLGPLVPGSSFTLQNSQCALNGTGSAVSGSSNTLTMLLNLTFSNTLSGDQAIYMYASDAAGLNSGWQNRGTLTLP